MGNNNVVAGPKEADIKEIEDQQNLEEINGIVSLEKDQVVSQYGINDLSEQIENSSSAESSGVEDPHAEKQMSESTEDIEAQSEVSKENADSTSEEMQDLEETEAVNGLSVDVELLGDNGLANETISENEETKDTDLLRDRIDEEQENRANFVHDTDSEPAEYISGNHEDKGNTFPVDEIETENESFGVEIENIDIGEKEAQSEVSKENGESPYEEMQELVQTEAVTGLFEDVELLGDNDLDANETILENEETKDADLLQYKIDGKQENGANLVHETDSGPTQNISGNEENKDHSLPIDEIETENVSFGNKIVNADIGENESKVEDSVNREVIKQIQDLEEVTKIAPQVETVAPDLTARMEGEGNIETILPIPDFQQADSEKETHDLENGSIPSINSEHNAGYELVTLKVPDLECENKELQALEPTADIPQVLLTKLMTDLETSTISSRLSTGSIQDKPSLNPELRKSPSFIFYLPPESKCEESDQTPLLYHNKAISRNISSPSSQPISVEEKTIQGESSDCDKLKGPFPNLLKKEGLDDFLKQDCQTSSSKNSLTKGSGKRKPSMFATCICCASAIS